MVKTFLKVIFGGTFGYVQAGILGFLALSLLWFWKDYGHLRVQNNTLKIQNDHLESALMQREDIVESLSSTLDRRAEAIINSKDLENDIRETTDSVYCAASEPHRVLLDGLYFDPKPSDTPTNTD